MAYRLDDRYTRDLGRVFLSGVQALARLPVEQLRVDAAAGLRTAAFVSGYPGSPLAGFDREAEAAAKAAADVRMHVQPGLNEELAASAVMGSQLAAGMRSAQVDGVIGIWYGKAPGLDRACDAIRHAVFTGTSRYGGAVAYVGDDPAAKSSTLPSSSDATLVDLHIPILYPGDVQETIDLGRHAIAMSRASGLWTSLKIVAGVADGTGTVDLDPSRVAPVMPVMEVDGRPFVPHPNGHLLPPYTLAIEKEFLEVRAEIARRYGIENRLNRITVGPADAWIGIVASGYTYHETLEALRVLGLRDDAAIAAAGIRLLQMRLPVPFDPAIVREFAHGLAEVLVIEEKNPTLEWLVKNALYGWDERPLVIGKRDQHDRPLIPVSGHVDADAILPALRRRLTPRLADRLAPEPAAPRERIPVVALDASRAPFFCSGCPHNTSTRVPEGALYGAGIGCHGMTLLMEEERVGTFTTLGAMGSEGAPWVGMAPFVGDTHLFQNLGDGTYFHSGQLAVRFAIAAGVNITYKLLYNGTVAMTGGQDAQGAVGVPELVTMLLLEGVQRVIITTDDTDKYAHVALPKAVAVWDRSRIMEAQELLAGVKGVTVLVHDQGCAAEKRRHRKRGTEKTPALRVVINERVCEGCGDCGDKSNCLSVQPVDTPFGRKTRIHQTSCNLDLSCLQGDCPSFMTVTPAAAAVTPDANAAPAHAVGAAGASARRNGRREPAVIDPATLPDPVRLVGDDVTVRMPGIGGTGVVTVSQVLATAAMLDGLHVRGLDQTGLSQKAGMVISDVRLSRAAPLPSNKATHHAVDVLLAFDLLGGASDGQLDMLEPARTIVVASTTETPTGAMVIHPDRSYPELGALRARLDPRSDPARSCYVDAGAITEALFGDTTAANVFLLGVAVQHGALPVAAVRVEEAIELNGVAVARNQAAFRWGRRWVADRAAVEAAVATMCEGGPAPTERPDPADVLRTAAPVLAARTTAIAVRTGLGDDLVRRVADLVGYQSVAYARRYLDRVDAVGARAESVAGVEAARPLTRAAAEQLHRLMAYKDEYEVARLLLAPEARAAAEAVGGPGAKVTWRLHPPLLRSLGLQHKLSLGPWAAPVLRALARARRVRGTVFDPFGYARVRRLERALVGEYEAALDTLCDGLTPASLGEAAAIAALPDRVRGYEGIKLARAAAYRAELASRLVSYAR